MNIKRVTLLAGMALASTAFAVPATASASGTWTSGHQALKGEAFVDLTGIIAFSSILPAYNYECDVHAKMVMTGADEGTGHLTEFNLTTSSCVGEGAAAGCEIAEHKVTKKPEAEGWMLTATDTDIIVTSSVFYDFKFKGCLFKELGTTLTETTLDPDKATEISELQITDVGGVGTTSGSLEVVGEGAGAYGVH